MAKTTTTREPTEREDLEDRILVLELILRDPPVVATILAGMLPADSEARAVAVQLVRQLQREAR